MLAYIPGGGAAFVVTGDVYCGGAGGGGPRDSPSIDDIDMLVLDGRPAKDASEGNSRPEGKAVGGPTDTGGGRGGGAPYG